MMTMYQQCNTSVIIPITITININITIITIIRVFSAPTQYPRSWTVIRQKPVSSSSCWWCSHLWRYATRPYFMPRTILEPLLLLLVGRNIRTSIGAKPSLWARHPIFQPSNQETTSYFNSMAVEAILQHTFSKFMLIVGEQYGWFFGIVFLRRWQLYTGVDDAGMAGWQVAT